MSIRRGNKIIASRITNGFSLFDCKWSDHILNNISWLRADTFSWQSGNVYKAAYEHLANDSVKLYAWAVGAGFYYTLTETPVVGDNVYSSNVNDDPSQIENVDNDTITFGDPRTGVQRVATRDATGDSNSFVLGISLKTDSIGDIKIKYTLSEDGHKICSADQESNIMALYAKTGAADYYLIDTTNKRFKLPRKQKRRLIQAVKNDDGTWYNLYSDGWVEQGGLITNTTVYTLPVTMANTNYYVSVTWDGGKSQNFYPSDFRVRNLTTTTFTTTASRDGSNVQGRCWQVKGYAAESAYASAGMRLEYYYVGNFEQTAIEQTAGINTELFNNKADLNLSNTTSNIDFVVESQLPTSANGYTWYRKYKSGWVEQGGQKSVSANATLAVTLSKTMANANYFCTASGIHNSVDDRDYMGVAARSTTTITIANGHNAAVTFVWQVSGMAA